MEQQTGQRMSNVKDQIPLSSIQVMVVNVRPKFTLASKYMHTSKMLATYLQKAKVI